MPVYYNTWNSKKSKKPKFKSAEAKRQYEESLNSEFGLAKRRKKVYNADNENSTYMINPKPYIRETKYIPSRGNGIGNAVKPEDKVYTGTKMIGIGTLHKSNAVPVFTDDDAKDMASMRR